MDDVEREYVEAKAAYDSALQRLVAAKKAIPPKLSAYQQRRANDLDAIWQAWLAGERDYGVLASSVGRSRSWVTDSIRETLRQRRYGPETLQDYKSRLVFEEVTASIIQRYTPGNGQMVQ